MGEGGLIHCWVALLSEFEHPGSSKSWVDPHTLFAGLVHGQVSKLVFYAQSTIVHEYCGRIQALPRWICACMNNPISTGWDPYTFGRILICMSVTSLFNM